LRLNNELLAGLLARYHNVNFVDENKEHFALTAKDFLRTPDDVADDGDDTDDAERSAAEVAAAIAAAARSSRAGMGNQPTTNGEYCTRAETSPPSALVNAPCPFAGPGDSRPFA
jgi:hypothetical protein